MRAPALLPRVRSSVPGLVRRSVLSAPPPPTGRLQAAVTALFVLDGVVFGSWAARVPDVAVRTGADHTTLGVALLYLSLGALL